MIGCLRTRVRKQPIIALYFESENELKFYNLEAWTLISPPVAWVNKHTKLTVLSGLFGYILLIYPTQPFLLI